MLQRKREAEAERQKQAKAAGIAALFGAGSGRIPAGVDAPMAGADTAGSSGQFAGGGEDGPSSTGQPASDVAAQSGHSGANVLQHCEANDTSPADVPTQAIADGTGIDDPRALQGASTLLEFAGELRPPDVDVEPLLDEESLDEATSAKSGGVMHAYIKAVRARLQFELDDKFPAFSRQWLLDELRDREWWLRGTRCAWVVARLSTTETGEAGLADVEFEPSYIRDVFVWLPDLRWPGTMPACPTCGSADSVGNHGFRVLDAHLARRRAGYQSLAASAAPLYSEP